MRTTIRIDDPLLSEVKQLAARTNRTLTAVIEEALRLSLSLQKDGGKRTMVQLHTFKGQGLMPGVDLDDNASLLDLMSRDSS
ncbi:MAG: ribbon-helix-helix protein, CopG family [Planctomycetes bacterium]|nr:ribbon-helix-helix protein, CopG family [Planctomycetota bacterium]